MCKAVRLRGERSAGLAGRVGAVGLQSQGTRRPEGLPSEPETIPFTCEVMGAHGGWGSPGGAHPGGPWSRSPRMSRGWPRRGADAGEAAAPSKHRAPAPHAWEPVPGTGWRKEQGLLRGRPTRQREAGLQSVSPSRAPGEMVGLSAPDFAGPQTVRFWKLPTFRFWSVLVLWFQGGEFRAHKGYFLVLLRGWGSVSWPCGCPAPAPGEGREPAAGGPLRSRRCSFCPGSREGPGPAAASS